MCIHQRSKKMPPGLAVLWIEVGGKPKWLRLSVGYYDTRRTAPVLLETFCTLQITDTVMYWRSGKSAFNLRVPIGLIFQITDTVTYGTFSTVKSMQRLDLYSEILSYISTGLNTWSRVRLYRLVRAIFFFCSTCSEPYFVRNLPSAEPLPLPKKQQVCSFVVLVTDQSLLLPRLPTK